jgi:hypothetical protein
MLELSSPDADGRTPINSFVSNPGRDRPTTFDANRNPLRLQLHKSQWHISLVGNSINYRNSN